MLLSTTFPKHAKVSNHMKEKDRREKQCTQTERTKERTQERKETTQERKRKQLKEERGREWKKEKHMIQC